MENRTINLAVVVEVAKALRELKPEVVFVGGAVVSLYADVPAADDIRPTADIDMTIMLTSFQKWTALQKRLAELGFYPDPFGHSICSYKYQDIPVDILPAADGPLGPANRWYAIGFDELVITEVHGESIQIFSAPCYLATKIEAFNNRGTDYRTSPDFEDVVYVLDNREKIVAEIEQANQEVREFLIEQFRKILNNSNFEEMISVHIHPLLQDERLPVVLDKMKRIVK